MRAVVSQSGVLDVREIERPIPGPGEVLVKTLACGICGSDLHALQNSAEVEVRARRAGGMPVADTAQPVVAGHEFCAEIVEFGPDTVQSLAIGTRVCAEPVVFDENGIVDPVGFSNRSPGGYGQYMVLLEALLIPVPDHVSDAEAALTEPLAVGIHAVNAAATTDQHIPLVMGCGPVGLAVIAALKHRGRGPIVASDFSPERRELARRMGAEYVVDPAVESPWEVFRRVAELPPGEVVDRPVWKTGPMLRPQEVYECVGVPGVLQQIFSEAEPRSRIVVVGVCMQEDTIEPLFALNRELDVRFVMAHNVDEFQQALDVIAEGEIPFREIISTYCDLDAVPKMFETLSGPHCHAKVIVEPWR